MKVYNNKKLIEKYLKDTSYTYDDYKLVIDHIEDEKSKILFFYRLMMDFTSDSYYTIKIIQEMLSGYSYTTDYQLEQKYFMDFLLKNDNYKKGIVLIGQNIEVVRTLIFLSGVNEKLPKIVQTCDFFEDEYTYNAKPDYPVKCSKIESLDFNKDYVYLITKPELKYMKKWLLDHGVSRDNIFTFIDNRYVSYCYLQYFSEPDIEPGENEVFIDGGCADLDTSMKFIQWSRNKYEKIYAFEPLTDSYQKCLNTIDNYGFENIEMIKAGLWNKKETLKFDEREFNNSQISDEGSTSIDVDTIDNVLNGRKATFIKLDIEGSEKEALEGAEKTIKKYKPKLAISIYHKYLDCLILASYIIKLNNNYKLKVRHYNISNLETVLYAY